MVNYGRWGDASTLPQFDFVDFNSMSDSDFKNGSTYYVISDKKNPTVSQSNINNSKLASYWKDKLTEQMNKNSGIKVEPLFCRVQWEDSIPVSFGINFGHQIVGLKIEFCFKVISGGKN